MAEEHRFQAPEGHCLFANNCGFFGSHATLDLCSKCYRNLLLRKQQTPSATSEAEKSINGTPTEVVKVRTDPFPFARSAATARDSASFSPALESAGPSEATQPNRCSVCRKRVGLTGFRCRCRSTFCGAHRYPEQHECSFDFQAAGREAIAAANPVFKAPKTHKLI